MDYASLKGLEKSVCRNRPIGRRAVWSEWPSWALKSCS